VDILMQPPIALETVESGKVDLKSNLNKDREAFCQQGSCYISHTEAGEYVEYLFHTTTDIIDLVVSERVASFRIKPYSMWSWWGKGKLNTMEPFGLPASKGWQTFEEQTWVVPGVVSGNHTLRVIPLWTE
jgi:hypothetical protein